MLLHEHEFNISVVSAEAESTLQEQVLTYPIMRGEFDGVFHVDWSVTKL